MKEVKTTVNGTEINVLTFSPEEIDRIHRKIDEHRRTEQEARRLKNNLDMNSSYGKYAGSYVERIKDYAEAGNKCCEADYKCVGDEFLRGYVKRLTKI